MATYSLELDDNGGRYVRARLIKADLGAPDSQLECFEIGDPVYLQSSDEEDEVWWVQSFYQVKGEAQAYISENRTCTWPDTAVPIYDLVEIPAMMRLAIEASG